MLLKDRYEVQDELGFGAFGRVNRAFDRVAESYVAIKFLTNIGAIDIFQKEVKLLYQQINNRFVVKLLDHEITAKSPYIVLEYCHGGSLRSWVGKSSPWQQVAHALSCATAGLDEIHRSGGFHRDIKPDNLLMTTDPDTKLSVVKLGDLGLARIPDAGTMTYSPAGTKNYMAPEVLDALLKPNHISYQYTPAADIYSLGITALELLTGSIDLKSLEKWDDHKAPNRLIHLIKRMCAQRAEDRLSTGDIAKELGVILAPPPITVPEVIAVPAALQPSVVLPQPVLRAPVQAPQGDSAGAVIAGIGLGALALLGLAALLKDTKEWDPAVGRYRGADGRFKG